jgi:hypothetical protein
VLALSSEDFRKLIADETEKSAKAIKSPAQAGLIRAVRFGTKTFACSPQKINIVSNAAMHSRRPRWVKNRRRAS